MGRFLLRRLGLAILTLLLLSFIVFVGTHVLPGDVGRVILGPFADARAVAQLDKELGADQPLLVQYWTWISGVFTGDLGQSLAFQQSVSSLLFPALLNSLKLALVAFVIVVPLGIFGGIVAALNRDRFVDRALTITGLSSVAVPEFATGIVLIVIFAVNLKWFPVTAQAPDGSGPLTQLRYLLLPAIALVFVLFGYIARITRAGVIEALDADYTRTATLKGLPRQTVIRRHVLRNALLPTIAVVATQTGYLIGGLVAIEVLFNYQGIGHLVFLSAQKKDLPVLEACVLVVGIVYLVATVIADVIYSLLNPRIRYGASE
jgi:peptide/nickel transport system permease protein